MRWGGENQRKDEIQEDGEVSSLYSIAGPTWNFTREKLPVTSMQKVLARVLGTSFSQRLLLILWKKKEESRLWPLAPFPVTAGFSEQTEVSEK